MASLHLPLFRKPGIATKLKSPRRSIDPDDYHAEESMDDKEAAEVVEKRLDDIESLLLNDGQAVSQAISRTNALFYSVDDCVVRYAHFDEVSGRILFRAFLHFEGDQDDDKTFLGDELDVELSGELRLSGTQWQLSYYSIESCDIKF